MVETATKVIIIGAGSAGLLLAQGLKSAGVPFLIFERHAKDHQSREWGMSMHWGGEFLANTLPSHLRDRLWEIDVDPRYDSSKDGGYVMSNGETAETLVVMPGVMPRRYGKKLEAITVDGSGGGSVTASFEDGTSARGKFLVGSDGSRSKVRAIMLGSNELAEPYEAGCTIINYPQAYPADIATSLRDIHPVMKVAYHPKSNVMHLLSVLDGTSSNPEEWTFQNVISWAGRPFPADLTTPESRVARVRELGKPFAHPWRTAAEQTPDGATVYVDRGTSWDPRVFFKPYTPEDEKVEATSSRRTRWNGHDWHGRVTLAGDAAHVMLPHRGQGLNNALEDAARLVKALTEVFNTCSSSLQDAVVEYETEMVTRGGAEVELTMKQSRAAHDWDMLMQAPMFRHGANKVKQSTR